MSRCASFFVSIILLNLCGCIEAEPRRSVRPKVEHTIPAGPYLVEIEQGALAISIIENVLSISEIFQEKPHALSASLKNVSSIMRYLARPDFKTSDGYIHVEVQSMSNLSTLEYSAEKPTNPILKARFTEAEKPVMNLVELQHTREAGVDSFKILESSDDVLMINLPEIFRMYLAGTTVSAVDLFLGGEASYKSVGEDLINVDAKDLEFVLLETNELLRLTFSLVMNEKNGSLVGGTLTGKGIDQKTGKITKEYNWDIEQLAKHTKHWPVYQEIINSMADGK